MPGVLRRRTAAGCAALGFVALTWGYVGLYGTEYLLRRARMQTVVLLHVCTFTAAAACVASLAPGACSTSSTPWKTQSSKRILGRLTSWETCGALWVGMSLSCRALTALVRLCDRRLLTAAS